MAPAQDQQGTKPISQLLVISGFAGAGKTTFMTQLAARQLPQEILDSLPAGADSWPQSEGRRPVDDLAAILGSDTRTSRLPGLVLHHDLMVLSRLGLSCYAEDPSLELLRFADRTDVVLIDPPLKRLCNQRRRQVFGGRSRLETSLNYLRWRFIRALLTGIEQGANTLPKPLMKSKFMWRQRKALKTRIKNPPKAELAIKELEFYRSPGAPQLLLHRWHEFMCNGQTTFRIRLIATLRPKSDIYCKTTPEWERE